jgi:hypothetical protein
MISKFDLFTVGPVRRWLHLRAERKAMLLATDYLSHLPDDILDDIGLSRVGIACAWRTRRSSLP